MKTARIEVSEKQGIYDALKQSLIRDIKDMGIRCVEDVECIQVYTLCGDFSQNDIKRVSEELLADKVSQRYNYSAGIKMPLSDDTHVIEIAYNPGVMDPVSQSAIKAVRDMGVHGVESIITSKKYIIKGPVSEKYLKEIRERLLYNKVIQHIVLVKDSPQVSKPYKFKHVEIDIINADNARLACISRRGQLYLSLIEMRRVRKYFKDLGRNPTSCELEIIAQTWSEHCKHKTMMGRVRYNGKKIANLLKETIVKATNELNKPWCVSVFKDNAGIIKFDSKYNVCFKVETHNHPSALEPYGGAETGIGGVIRDSMGTGRGAKPILNTDVFCFGIPETPLSLVPKGVLHPKRVIKGVVSGVRDYGNKMGIPTVNGAVCFDARYMANPLVFCGNVGIMPREFSEKKVSIGDLIVAVGGKTGRDGIHGATFSSAELTTESENISGTAVQIGNPITEKKMLDTLLQARDKGLYEAITDCGAGGFSSAVGEMAFETGAEVYLEKVPLKYEGLSPWEIWVSEAQERMVLAVNPEKIEELMKIFEAEEGGATVIGRFTGTKKLRIFYNGNKVADLDMDFVHDGLPKITRKAVWREKKQNSGILPKEKNDLTGALLTVLSNWNISSKEWIIRQYDHEVQAGSVLKPLIGIKNDGPSDASVTRPFFNSNKGIALANGINPAYGDIDTYWMSASAIDEALRQIVAVGGRVERTALLDNFCWGNTDKPAELGKLVRACQACYDMAKAYGTPFISGKDSLNNEFNMGKRIVSIPPTLLISAICVIDDVAKTISSDIKRPGNLIYILGRTFQEMGASAYFSTLGRKGGLVPRVKAQEALKLMNKISLSIEEGIVLSAHDCSEGGLGVCLSEMLFAGGCGAMVSLENVPMEKSITRDDVVLFSESNSRFIVEVASEKKEAFENIMKGSNFGVIGCVSGDKELIISGLKGKEPIVKIDIDTLKETWKRPFGRLMHEED